MLRKELPNDTEVAEALFHAQVALKTARGEEVANMKFGGEVETITSIEQLRDAIHSPGELFFYKFLLLYRKVLSWSFAFTH